jgi:cell division topological specificity factor
MAGFFERMLGRGSNKGSGATAKERLQFILLHDRINLPPDKLQAMKQEIMEVISKYVNVDRDKVDIALQQRHRDNLIVAEIPFSRPAETIDVDENEDLPSTLIQDDADADDTLEDTAEAVAEEAPDTEEDDPQKPD